MADGGDGACDVYVTQLLQRYGASRKCLDWNLSHACSIYETVCDIAAYVDIASFLVSYRYIACIHTVEQDCGNHSHLIAGEAERIQLVVVCRNRQHELVEVCRDACDGDIRVCCQELPESFSFLIKLQQVRAYKRELVASATGDVGHKFVETSVCGGDVAVPYPCGQFVLGIVDKLVDTSSASGFQFDIHVGLVRS